MKTLQVALGCSILFLMTAAGATSVNAQSSSSGCVGRHCAGGVPVVRHGYAIHGYGYRGYGHRGYPFDPRFGLADLVRAKAQSNAINAQARAQHALTDQVEMENSIQFLETRLERKRINKLSRFGHLLERGERVRETKLAAFVDAPAQPTSGPVEPATGQVNWPLLLQTKYYERARGPIDMVFRQRSLNGQVNPDHFLPMRDWIELIERELKSNVAYYEMEDYLQAKSFLRSLIHEARIEVRPGDSNPQLAAQMH